MKIFNICSILVCLISCNQEKSNSTIIPQSETQLNPINCPELTIDEKLEAWTKSKRKSVIKEVNKLQFDSIKTDTFNEKIINTFYFYKGIKVKGVGLSIANADTIGFYYNSPTTGFTANGENCPLTSDQEYFEGCIHTYRGLKHKDKHIGVATYLSCDKSTFEKRLYYRGQGVGIWKTINTQTKEIVSKNFERPEVVKALKQFILGH